MIFILFVAVVIFFHLKYLHDRRELILLHRQTLGDAPLHDEMILVKFEQFLMPIRYIEKLERWDLLTHAAKRTLARNLNTKVKRGKINPARLGNETLKIIPDEAVL